SRSPRLRWIARTAWRRRFSRGVVSSPHSRERSGGASWTAGGDSRRGTVRAQWGDTAVVRALGKRDLRRYFVNPAGYVFVTFFIFLGAAAAFWPFRLFLYNLGTLDHIHSSSRSLFG